MHVYIRCRSFCYTIARAYIFLCRPFKDPKADPKAPSRLVLLHRGHTDAGGGAGALSATGRAHADRLAELLSLLPLARVVSSGSLASRQTAAAVYEKQAGAEAVTDASCEAGWLSAEGLWAQLRAAVTAGPRGTAVAALVDEPTHAALVSTCLGLEEEQVFCLGAGGVSVIEFEGPADPGTIKCLNYHAPYS